MASELKLTHKDMFRLGDEIPVWVEMLREKTKVALAERRIAALAREAFDSHAYMRFRITCFARGQVHCLEVWEMLALQNAIFCLPRSEFPANRPLPVGKNNPKKTAARPTRSRTRKPPPPPPVHDALDV